jgi:hypothetical protein
MSKDSIRRWLALTLVVAGLAAISGEIDAAYYVRRGYVGGGSVHYGSSGTATRTTTTNVAGGSVHYGSSASGSRTTTSTISTTYSSDYMARLPGGYKTMPGAGGKTYAYYSKPPSGAQPTTMGGSRYYVHNNVYYKPTTYRGATVYMAVPPPR